MRWDSEIEKRRARTRKAIAEAQNRDAIERAIQKLDTLRYPFAAVDMLPGGDDVVVLEHFGDGLLHVQDWGGVKKEFRNPRYERHLREFASRYARRGKRLVPRIVLPEVAPIERHPGRMPEIVMYVWPQESGTSQALWVPPEVEARFPNVWHKIAFGGFGGFALSPTITPRMMQGYWRMMPKISEIYGGQAVRLVLGEPSPEVRAQWQT